MGRPLLEPPPHGTRARYQWRGGPCRCTGCRAANADYERSYRIDAGITRNPRPRPDEPWQQLSIPGT